MRGHDVRSGVRLAAALGCIASVGVLLASPWPARAQYLNPVERAETPLFTRASPLGDITYTAGRGLRVGDTGLTLGGYSNLTLIRDEGKRAELSLDDVSLFVVADPFPHLHLFSEIEYEDPIDLDERGHINSSDDVLSVERLYADVSIADALNIRTGIFLTPVGRWNMIHAAPLVWTTSRPLSTVKPFDEDVTGIMLFGSVFPRRGTVTYYLYDQFAPPIEGNPSFDPADHSVGARLELTSDDAAWSIGASFLAARREGSWRELGGLDLLWSLSRIEVMSELVIADGAGIGSEWGGYVQAAIALTPKLALIERYEHYDGPSAPGVNLIALGFAYRPLPAIVLKSEYLIADRRAPDAEPGVKASIATLF